MPQAQHKATSPTRETLADNVALHPVRNLFPVDSSLEVFRKEFIVDPLEPKPVEIFSYPSSSNSALPTWLERAHRTIGGF
ncbi:MAG: hypothetical protein ACKN9X_00940 [Candidatus Methylopumilus sp.]